MADAIKNATGIEAELVKGGGGVFDVVVNGNLIYSKHQTDRFPTHDEILSQLKNCR
ncbi:MAG: SelT/SelW/SelH family protein [Rhodopirellula sp.]|nr:SelT/SelW/SelH family protein [Rhodopirellula sp.]